MQGTRRFGSEESEPIDWIVAPKSESKSGSMTQPGLSEMFAYHATTMANTISTSLVVFSRKVWSLSTCCLLTQGTVVSTPCEFTQSMDLSTPCDLTQAMVMSTPCDLAQGLDLSTPYALYTVWLCQHQCAVAVVVTMLSGLLDLHLAPTTRSRSLTKDSTFTGKPRVFSSGSSSGRQCKACCSHTLSASTTKCKINRNPEVNRNTDTKLSYRCCDVTLSVSTCEARLRLLPAGSHASIAEPLQARLSHLCLHREQGHPAPPGPVPWHHCLVHELLTGC